MSRISNGEPGTIYCMRCESHLPGILKVGCTTDDPQVRAKQLTASTSSPTPFHVLYSRQVPDVNAAEKAVHSALAAYRVNENREYFKVSLYEAARTIDALFCETFSRFDPPTPFADLYSTFDPDGPPELTAEEQAQCRALEEKLGLYQKKRYTR